MTMATLTLMVLALAVGAARPPARPPALAAGIPSPAFADGDIVLQQSRSNQSAALKAATGSPYTHCGLVFRRNGTYQVLEAVQPVRWTPWSSCASRGREHRVVVVRLRDRSRLANGGAGKVRAAAERFLGRSYDTLFEWSDRRIYCSELVYKAYRSGLGLEVGEVRALSDFDLTSPEVKALVDARAHGRLDPSERVVAPVSFLSDSDLRVAFSNDPAVRVDR